MTKYEDVKEESIAIVDSYATNHDVVANYLEPPSDPKYSAQTKLAALGITKQVRRQIPKAVSQRMYARFKGDWQGTSAEELVNLKTIGDFIEIMCDDTGVTPPDSEPT